MLHSRSVTSPACSLLCLDGNSQFTHPLTVSPETGVIVGNTHANALNQPYEGLCVRSLLPTTSGFGKISGAIGGVAGARR